MAVWSHVAVRSQKFALRILSSHWTASCGVLEFLVPRLTVEYFSIMDLWPCWVLQANDPALRRTPEDAAAYEDFGNDIWEALVNLMNLSSAIPSVYGQEILNAPASAMYGDRAKKSGVGHYSFRGNVVERLLTYLLHASEQERLQCIHRLPQSAAGGN